MKCLNCQKNNAIKHPLFGWLVCKSCQKKSSKPRNAVEVTTEEVREGRKIYEIDITQPFRDGNLSKEFVQAYPEKVKEMIKEKHITESELKSVRNVWDGEKFYKNE